MSKANGTINAIGKIITYILVVLLVLGIAGGISYFVLRNQGITYYVEYGDEKYLADSDGGSAVTVTSAEESVTLPTMDCSLTLTPSFTYSDYTVEDTFAGEYKIVTTANVDTMYNALDDVDATAGSITLYEDDIMFSGSGSTYSMEFGFLDNATAGVGDTYYYYEDHSLFNGMFEWLRSNSTTPLFAFEYELTGTHSSVSGSIDVLFDVGSYTIAVSGVGLDESNLIF